MLSFIADECLDVKHRLWSLFVCESGFCGPGKDSYRISDGEHAVELACSLLIPSRLFLALWTTSFFLVKVKIIKAVVVCCFRHG